MDFLNFKEFISIPVLIGFYYLGALVMPVFMWFFSLWLGRKFSLVNDFRQAGKEKLRVFLSIRQKVLFIVLFLMGFLFMELFWRMLFEFLIAYMQIRDALV